MQSVRQDAQDGMMTLPNVESPDVDKYKNISWFVGIDPAVKVDFFGVVVHGLAPKPKGRPWMPMLKEVFEIDHPSYHDLTNWCKQELFRCYPPRYVIIDSTRDAAIAQELEKTYGEYRVLQKAMTNQYNYECKQNGYAFLQEGYRFPNTAVLQNQGKARTIANLQLQIMHERVLPTRDNRFRFESPPKAHNDLDRAWEYSLMAVRSYQKGGIGMIGKDRTYDSYPTKEITIQEGPAGSFTSPEMQRDIYDDVDDGGHRSSFDIPE